MLIVGHTSALRRSSEIRVMPKTEKLPTKPVDIYRKVYILELNFNQNYRELEIIFLKKISKKFLFAKSLLQQGFQQVIIK